MKINHKTNFSGYMHILRASQYLISDKILSFSEYAMYLIFIFQSDYEKRHKNTYGVITRTDEEIASALNCDTTTIYKHRKNLIKKGLLTEENGITRVTNLYLFQHPYPLKLTKYKYPIDKLHYLFAKPQVNEEVFQSIIAKLQENHTQTLSIPSNVSSKVDLSSSNEEIDIDDIEI